MIMKIFFISLSILTIYKREREKQREKEKERMGDATIGTFLEFGE